MTESCFHCALPVPAGCDYPIRYRQHSKPACCAGCQAVAQTIIDAGLDDYYQHRSTEAGQAEALPDELLQQIRLYDSESLQQSFVHVEDGHVREASLILEGITCAACIWLNEQHLQRQDGILSVDINYTTHRARVRWDTSRIKLSQILEAIAAIGYRAHPYDAARQEALQQKQRKQAINRLWVAGLSMMQVMMYAVPVYLAPDGEIEPDFLWMLHWASLILTLPVMVYSAVPFYQATWRDLKRHRVGMDTPVTIGILTTFFASLYALLNHIEHGIYFDSVSMFVFLLLGGRYLEGIARREAGAAAETLVKLIPAFAHKLSAWPESRETHEAAAATLSCGDVLLIRPGETVPADACVLEGHSQLNEALLTGESRLLDKQAGDALIAGSVNTASPLYVRITGTGQNTRLASIVRLLDQALAEKPRLAEIADRFAGWFVLALLLAAVATFAWWYPHDPEHALWITVAVLVISCPCALSLATPAALTAATGRLALDGVLTTRGHALEALARASDVVFDKTGTLTHGDMRLIATRALDGRDPAKLLALAAGLETGSEHPIARAILAATPQAARCEQLDNHAGQGVQGIVQGQRYRLGKPDFVAALSGSASINSAGWHDGATVIALGDEQGVLALFAIGDRVRDDAKAMLTALKQAGLKVHLLSGDALTACSNLAAQLGIDHIKAEATPEDKLAYVRKLQTQGCKVVMLGDGINDAPVLMQADVSIAMGGGTDVATASGDMILMGDRLALLPDAFALARKTLAIIRQNLWWAAAYNLLALPLAMSGHVTPWIASLGMACSSLVVVSNALRLNKRKS
ncbi:heavy metal translocating P-type ATPase [Craterilacuibacter sinensis]|uniref:Cadmium-translocating P-type ATPase n=1 Tax=Craterilacuibacter sinensis TaxID=2686017 RepID=A0A845BW55_9NEIS|nr:heavy metal translocating P-type ATPase [Craterilacuibacter sinensis]MXR38346.1 cadmium-translocating P-type ATPase [Craterilacuibacter sinensis]